LASAGPAAAAFSSVPDVRIQTNGAVSAIAQSADRTYFGGSFTRAGVPIGFGASLAPGSGAPDYSFAKPNDAVYTAISDGAGGWFIGGTFTTVGNIPRSRLAHLLADGTVDPAFNPTMGSHSIGPRGADVRALALDGTTLYAGGDFDRVGTGANMVTRNFLAAIDVTTGQPTSFDAHVTPNDQSQFVEALAVSGSRVWAGGTLYANPLYKNLIANRRDALTGIGGDHRARAGVEPRPRLLSTSPRRSRGEVTSKARSGGPGKSSLGTPPIASISAPITAQSVEEVGDRRPELREYSFERQSLGPTVGA
jgi:hypothetical protein